MLNSPERETIRKRVRSRLGIADGTTAVLYAPTWRDNFVDELGNARFQFALDAPSFSDRLGGDHVLLLRMHYYVPSETWGVVGPPVKDVSAHPDISELYLAADVLVADYSSAMFDFAVTGKPIILFAYDLRQYRDEVRGFYLDYEAQAPGPVLTTSAEVIEALENLEEVERGAVARYRAFRDRFCYLDDGHASDRVVDHLLSLID